MYAAATAAEPAEEPNCDRIGRNANGETEKGHSKRDLEERFRAVSDVEALDVAYRISHWKLWHWVGGLMKLLRWTLSPLGTPET